MRDLETPTYICLQTEAKSWVDSKAEAVRNGGTLVSIQCEQQNSLVNNLRGGSRVWIGFNDRDTEDTFKWTDGEDEGFRKWYGNEPNDSGENEDCTEMWNSGSGGTWNDRNCDTNLKAVYQTESPIDGLSCQPYYRKFFFLYRKY